MCLKFRCCLGMHAALLEGVRATARQKEALGGRGRETKRRNQGRETSGSLSWGSKGISAECVSSPKRWLASLAS